MPAFQTPLLVLVVAGTVALVGNRLFSAIDPKGSHLHRQPSGKHLPVKHQLVKLWRTIAIALAIAVLVGGLLGCLRAPVPSAAEFTPADLRNPLAELRQPPSQLPQLSQPLRPQAAAVLTQTDSNTPPQPERPQPDTEAETAAPPSPLELTPRDPTPPSPPSRWQQMQGVLFIFYILVLSGVIATIGDRLGYRIGKKRLSWFNLRPRDTAVLVTILTGIVISASSVGVLLLTNRSIADALFNYGEQVNAYQTQIQVLEGNIEFIQGQLSTLEAERLEAENRVEELTEVQAELRMQREAAEAEVALANQELADARLQLGETQASLKDARQETIDAEADAAAARDRVQLLQASLHRTEEDLKSLQSQKSDLETDIANLTAVAEQLRRGEFAVLAGEPLATGVIQGGMTPGEIQRGLDNLFSIAERRARTLGAEPTSSAGRAIQIRVSEVTRAIQEISAPGSWVVQIFSLTNRLVGEPVPVITGVLPNQLLFAEGTVLAETSILPGGSDEDIEATLVRLFLQAGQKSRNEGILFNTSTGTVGEFPQSRLFELVQTLRLIDEPIQVQVVAERDIYTSGPLEVDLVSKALNSSQSDPDSSDTVNGAEQRGSDFVQGLSDRP